MKKRTSIEDWVLRLTLDAIFSGVWLYDLIHKKEVNKISKGDWRVRIEDGEFKIEKGKV